jgi:hypothetical protein
VIPYVCPERENAMSLTISTSSSASTLVAEITDTEVKLSLTEVECSSILLVRILNWYLEKLAICAQHNSAAAAAIHNVVSLSASPQILLEPRLVGRVLAAALSRRAARNRALRLDAADKGAF